jgi:SOS-response transcriptional repressor LexA
VIRCPDCGHRFELARTPLTPKQRLIYGALAGFIAERGHAPTIKELSVMAGGRGNGQIIRYLVELEQRGWIVRARGKARAITLTGEG